MISTDKLDFWVNNNMNVLLKAKHGVGKTHIITDTFTRHNLKYLYFSGSTMDPWVDFVGVPKEFTDENNVTYLDLVRPKPFAYDDVEAIFIDELNRSPSKVRNAIMELLQFKSINGKKFHNLRMIWAAVNPPNSDDVQYQTEEFDPAQEDRFHVIYSLPYKPDMKYFTKKYGADKASVAINWWSTLTQEQKNTVSPRRLDLALSYIDLQGDVRDVLPKTVNVTNLVSQLLHGSYKRKFDVLLKDIKNGGSYDKMQEFLSNSNAVEDLKKELKNIDTITAIANAMPMEVLFKFLSETKTFDTFVAGTKFADNVDLHIKIAKEGVITKKTRQILNDNIKQYNKTTLLGKVDVTVSDVLAKFDLLAEEAYTTPYRIKAMEYIINTPELTYALDDASGTAIAKNIIPLMISTQESTFKRSVNITKDIGALRMKELRPYVIKELYHPHFGYSGNIRTRIESYFDKYQ